MNDQMAQRVDRFNALYGFYIDENLEKWSSLFSEQCEYRITSKQNELTGLPAGFLFFESRDAMDDRVASLLHSNIYPEMALRHINAPCIITEITDGVIHASSNFVVFETRSQSDVFPYAAGRYIDELIENRDSGFEIRKRVCVIDNDIVRTLMAMPL